MGQYAQIFSEIGYMSVGYTGGAIAIAGRERRRRATGSNK